MHPILLYVDLLVLEHSHLLLEVVDDDILSSF